MELIASYAVIVILLGLAVILKRGFNEVIKGLEAINEKLDKLNKERSNSSD